MGAVGALETDVVCQVKAIFESRCAELLQQACLALKTQKHIDIDWGEENITANLYVFIHNSQQAIDYDIHPETEHPFFSKEVLDNKKKAKSAQRIDLVFQYNWSGKRFSFYVEAKNLIEIDSRKTGRKTLTKASAVIKRYVETGIDHYLSGYYPCGCMLGYVLNGTIPGIVASINAKLRNEGRHGEDLTMVKSSIPWAEYRSNHISKGMQITHYLFEFN